MEDTMDIRTSEGEKVIYTGKNGYDLDRDFANQHLIVGETYIIDNIEIYNFSSIVQLVGYPMLRFNTVHFENIEDDK